METDGEIYVLYGDGCHIQTNREEINQSNQKEDLVQPMTDTAGSSSQTKRYDLSSLAIYLNEEAKARNISLYIFYSYLYISSIQ
jgi:hypothetical protein